MLNFSLPAQSLVHLAAAEVSYPLSSQCWPQFFVLPVVAASFSPWPTRPTFLLSVLPRINGGEGRRRRRRGGGGPRSERTRLSHRPLSFYSEGRKCFCPLLCRIVQRAAAVLDGWRRDSPFSVLLRFRTPSFGVDRRTFHGLAAKIRENPKKRGKASLLS